ncbi:MAG TPA: hypothetical protein VK071_08440 [Tissierellales bacterium]|nr:hypothetical protein [Tissierellales bacterium]
MALLELIYGKYKTISIVGMAKNSGKTVTLNFLIEEAINKNITIGVTSTGRDGEPLDLVTETEKPKIFVEKGTLVATTTDLLPMGDAKVEILEVTDYRTPLGFIVIGRVKDKGYIQIAGPQRSSEIKKVSERMLQLGAEFVIIDGAIDRKSSAAPSISESTIVSTGAVLSRDINKVIEETLHLVNLFKLSKVEDKEVRLLTNKLIREGKVAIIDSTKNMDNLYEIDERYKVNELKVKTALNCGNIIGENIEENTKYIVLPGSLVKKTVEDIIQTSKKYKSVKIIVEDGTKIFIKPKDWLKFQKQGIEVEVLNDLNLIALTINPYAPEGYFFEPEKFLTQMRTYIKDLPVYDLLLGGI